MQVGDILAGKAGLRVGRLEVVSVRPVTLQSTSTHVITRQPSEGFAILASLYWPDQ